MGRMVWGSLDYASERYGDERFEVDIDEVKEQMHPNQVGLVVEEFWCADKEEYCYKIKWSNLKPDDLVYNVISFLSYSLSDRFLRFVNNQPRLGFIIYLYVMP